MQLCIPYRAPFFLLLVILLTGTAHRSSAFKRPTHPKTAWFEPRYQQLATKAAVLQQREEFSEAAALYRAGLKSARLDGDTRAQSRLLNNLAGIRLAVTDYRSATNLYMEALSLAEQDHDVPVLRSILLNLASLYHDQGDLDSAAAIAAKAEANITGDENLSYSVNIFLRFARIQARKKDWQSAEQYFHRAIAKSAWHSDAGLEASAWDNLGYERMLMDELDNAEVALTEAFRLRVVSKNPQICLSYSKMGVLRFKQKRFLESESFLNRAAACTTVKLTPLQRWTILQYRARVLQALGDNHKALVDLRAAIALARSWKLDILPVDGLRTAAETEFQSLYDSYIEASSNEALGSTSNSDLVWESFLTAQENHAWSFRQLKQQGGAPLANLPEAYYDTVAKLRQIEGNTVFNPSGAVADTADLRLTLRNLELQAGITGATRESQVQQLARKQSINALTPSQALIAFHFSPESTLAWVLTREGLSIKKLPNQLVISRQLQRYLTLLKSPQNEPNLDQAGQELSDSLLGQVEPLARQKSEWLLILDRQLFTVPFAALPLDRAGTYLIEKHSLRILPSFQIPETEDRAIAQGFLGIGDPIYNRIDDRLSSPGQFPVSETQLPRLPNSGRELEQCARALRSLGQAQLFTGERANFATIRDSLATHPKLIHFAGHFVQNGAKPEAALALSLTGKGYPELLTSTDIAALSTNADLVTMSGCSSGIGAGLPGSGLMGLTRAWLAAGAGATIASQWPTPDDSGEIFATFYSQLARYSGRVSPAQVAEALRQAQLASLRSSTFRKRPAFWAAFFVVGKG